MHAILRPYAAAGVVIAGTGLIAATPVVAPAPAPAVASVADVALTGLSNFVDTWQDVINTTNANLSILKDNYMLAPGVAFQQLYANWMGYIDQFLNDPSSSTLAAINTEIQQNWVAVRDGYTLPLDVSSKTLDTVTNHTIDGSLTTGHAVILAQVPGYLPAGTDVDMVNSILNFMVSPLSGIIIGMLGPGISPWVALLNSITDGDSFSEILANTWGGFLNGATLNLDFVLPSINDAGFLPAGMSLDHLEFAFGGLLSTGSVQLATYQSMGDDGEVDASVPVVGGSILNSLGLQMVGVPLLGQIVAEGQAIGPIAAFEMWGQVISALLGSGWDGEGTVVVNQPALGVDLPPIPDDFTAEATNFFGGFQDFFDSIFG
ncbi:outer membrane porin GjpA [Mycolicibacter heraklionensis]|uniref:Outer membrane porin GjpA n=1 Tax=Mycolicibacter heraklionensis TaxID=512402 RepID=A0A9X7WG25_9MYCO|nr:outer membrane porin GjpA [Mycolicibacter heraklionensis]QZA07598.1 outer membrane porin GjpA [Mycolicibacter heraklionensis]